VEDSNLKGYQSLSFYTITSQGFLQFSSAVELSNEIRTIAAEEEELRAPFGFALPHCVVILLLFSSFVLLAQYAAAHIS